MRWTGATLAVLVSAVASVLMFAPASEATCHIASFEKDSYAVKENAGKVVLTVRLLDPQAATCGGAVRYRTYDGSATAPEDYQAKNEIVCFTSGGPRERSVSIPIVNDGVFESNETFGLKLESATQPGCLQSGQGVGANDSASVTIKNGDAEPAGGGGASASVAPEPQPDLESLAPDVTSTPEVTASATPAETAEGTASPLAAPEESDDDGAPVGLIVGALVAAAAAATGAGVLWARSRGTGTA